MNLLHVLLKQERTFFVLHGLTAHSNDFRNGVTIGMLDEIDNGSDGIAHDLAFGPAESGSESLGEVCLKFLVVHAFT